MLVSIANREPVKLRLACHQNPKNVFLVVHVLALSRYWCCSYTLYFCLLELEVYVLVLFCSRAYISLFKVNY